MAASWTNRGAWHATKTGFDNMDIRALLMKVTTAITKDTNTVSEIAAGEVTGGSYARVTLTGVELSEIDASDIVELLADYAVFLNVPAQGVDLRVVVFDHTGGADSSRVVLGYSDLTPGIQGVGQPITVSWGAATAGGESRGAVLRLTHAA